jgi:hypothetical protein
VRFKGCYASGAMNHAHFMLRASGAANCSALRTASSKLVTHISQMPTPSNEVSNMWYPDISSEWAEGVELGSTKPILPKCRASSIRALFIEEHASAPKQNKGAPWRPRR